MRFAIFLFALTRFVSAAPSDDWICADYLGVPVQHVGKFTSYVNNKFVTPMGHVHADEDWGHSITVTSLSTTAEPRETDSAELFYGFDSMDPRIIDYAEVAMARDLAPEFTYRMLFAHLLDRWPNVISIKLSVFTGPEHGAMRELLAKGVSIDSTPMRNYVSSAKA